MSYRYRERTTPESNSQRWHTTAGTANNEVKEAMVSNILKN
jgi:hypothetical protein